MSIYASINTLPAREKVEPSPTISTTPESIRSSEISENRGLTLFAVLLSDH